MANLIKNASSQGLYFLNGKSAGATAVWVSNNTPGECDLALLSLYTTYIYFDSVIQIQYQFMDKWESDTMRGYRIEADTEGTQKYFTGGHDREFIIIVVETTRTIAEGWMNFEKYWNKVARGSTDELVLVRQYASETFRQFANQTPALKKYIPVVILGCTIVEGGTPDRHQITITTQAIW